MNENNMYGLLLTVQKKFQLIMYKENHVIAFLITRMPVFIMRLYEFLMNEKNAFTFYMYFLCHGTCMAKKLLM